MATELIAQEPFALRAPEPRPLTMIDLLQVALQKDAAIDVIERLAALQREEREYQAKVSFDNALSRCQAKLGRISADATNPSTRSAYATYAKLDSVVRPIYSQEGFSMSFGEKDCPIPGKTRFVAYVSREGVTREYQKDLTPSTEGPKGGAVMSPIHADGAADSYAKRYLLKDIFNIAIGEDDTDASSNGELTEAIEWIANASSPEELKRLYMNAYNQFEASPAALKVIIAAKNKRKQEF